MDAPDFEVTALLIDRDLFLDVVIASGTRPHLDDERKGPVVNFEDVRPVAKRGRIFRGKYEDVRNEVRRAWTADSSSIDPHLEDRPIKLRHQHVAELHFQPIVIKCHP